MDSKRAQKAPSGKRAPASPPTRCREPAARHEIDAPSGTERLHKWTGARCAPRVDGEIVGEEARGALLEELSRVASLLEAHAGLPWDAFGAGQPHRTDRTIAAARLVKAAALAMIDDEAATAPDARELDALASRLLRRFEDTRATTHGAQLQGDHAPGPRRRRRAAGAGERARRARGGRRVARRRARLAAAEARRAGARVVRRVERLDEAGDARRAALGRGGPLRGPRRVGVDDRRRRACGSPTSSGSRGPRSTRRAARATPRRCRFRGAPRRAPRARAHVAGPARVQAEAHAPRGHEALARRSHDRASVKDHRTAGCLSADSGGACPLILGVLGAAEHVPRYAATANDDAAWRADAPPGRGPGFRAWRCPRRAGARHRPSNGAPRGRWPVGAPECRYRARARARRDEAAARGLTD